MIPDHVLDGTGSIRFSCNGWIETHASVINEKIIRRGMNAPSINQSVSFSGSEPESELELELRRARKRKEKLNLQLHHGSLGPFFCHCSRPTIILGDQQPKKTRLHVFFATWFMTCQSFAGQGKGTGWIGLGWVHE
jgi:hypothetical protein